MKMNIEKALRNYLKGSGPRVKYKAFYESASKDPNATISVLFELLNEEVETMTDTKCLNKTIELINYLTIIITNFDEINRKIVGRRLNKLSKAPISIIPCTLALPFKSNSPAYSLLIPALIQGEPLAIW